MDYLIDGHNLIGQLSDIDLADPNDEMKLVLKLKSWAAADGRRKVFVYFDGGLPGGRKVSLSSSRVRVMFAGPGRIADELLIEHIKRVKDPAGSILITNDREIITAAGRKRIRVASSNDFGDQLANDKADRQALTELPDDADNPDVSPDDMQIWLNAFGDVGESAARPYQKKQPPPPPPTKKAPLPRRSVDELKEAGGLRDDEMAEWLMMFGDEPEGEAPSSTSRPKATPAKKQPRTPKTTPRAADRLKSTGAKLTNDEVDAWLDIFTEPDG